MLVLGIETSCDETAAAVVSDDRKILSNIVFTQMGEHRPYGGVVPEIAARSHLQQLPGVITNALAEANIEFSDLSGVAATAGPGLIGGVMVGLMTAKSIALVHGIPFVAINHMAAHALTPRLTNNLSFPYLALLVSGGHSQFVAVSGPDTHTIYGTTIDDAIGEAFDKTATLLGLEYPGGPAIEREARTGDPAGFDLPRPMLGRPNCDFSFSGLKTAVRRIVEEQSLTEGPSPAVADMAASFQTAAAEVVADRCRHAMLRFLEDFPDGSTLVAAGGVASNQVLRSTLEEAANTVGLNFIAPPPKLCTDNGAMVAWAGVERLQIGRSDELDFAPQPRWPLDELGSASQG